MITVGMHQREVDGRDIIAATFHPYDDVWYVITAGAEVECDLAMFINGYCEGIKPVGTLNEAINHLHDVREYQRAHPIDG